jgi:hypothetical protein
MFFVLRVIKIYDPSFRDFVGKRFSIPWLNWSSTILGRTLLLFSLLELHHLDSKEHFIAHLHHLNLLPAPSRSLLQLKLPHTYLALHQVIHFLPFSHLFNQLN